MVRPRGTRHAIGFIGGFGVPRPLDGTARHPIGAAVAIDAGLLGLFAVQHSVMARRWFKEWWTRLVPWPVERSTYVLFSSLALIALFAGWRPLGGSVWSVDDPTARLVLRALFAFGWGLVLVCTFLIGWFFAFWMTPTMTLSHLLFAIATTAYILVAIQFEERDLVHEHGRAYDDYRGRVPMLWPFGRRSDGEVTAQARTGSA